MNIVAAKEKCIFLFPAYTTTAQWVAYSVTAQFLNQTMNVPEASVGCKQYFALPPLTSSVQECDATMHDQGYKACIKKCH
jgi:hypothetical protein